MQKRTLVLGLTLLAGASLGLQASAQDAYPGKPVKIVVPYSAGGPADLLARTLGERLSQGLGQPVIIENKPGAGGHAGGEQVARAAADGYTLMLGTIAHNGAVKLYRNLRYDPMQDLQPVSLIAEAPSILIVNANSRLRSVADLLDYARKNPGKLTYGSAGDGSAMHMAAELFKYMTKIDYVHVPYRGGAPAMADLLGGQIDMLFESLGTAIPYLQGGKVRALAVSSPQRTPIMADVPTIAESGVPGYASVPWYTISAPKGVPAGIVNKLHTEINVALQSPELIKRWNALGVVPLGGTVAEAQLRNQTETRKWSAVIDAASIQAH